MTEFSLIPVPFHGDSVWAGSNDGSVLVAVKPICDNLGLAWNGQFERIKRHSALSKGIRVIRIPSPGGDQDTVCLPLRLIPGWLFGVDSKRVKPAIRGRLEQYQAECYEVLWAYFNGETRVPRPGDTRDIHARIEAHLHPHQLRVLAAIKAYPDLGGGGLAAVTGLSEENVRRCCYLLWWIGIVQVVKGQDGLRIEVVPPERRTPPVGPLKDRRAVKAG